MADWSDIFRAFQSTDIPVYLPGLHRGICKKPYIVVESFGTTPDSGGETGREAFGLTAYVPVEQMSDLTTMLGRIQQTMQPLHSSFRASGKISGLTLDATFRSAKATVYYDLMKKLH